MDCLPSQSGLVGAPYAGMHRGLTHGSLHGHAPPATTPLRKPQSTPGELPLVWVSHLAEVRIRRPSGPTGIGSNIGNFSVLRVAGLFIWLDSLAGICGGPEVGPGISAGTADSFSRGSWLPRGLRVLALAYRSRLRRDLGWHCRVGRGSDGLWTFSGVHKGCDRLDATYDRCCGRLRPVTAGAVMHDGGHGQGSWPSTGGWVRRCCWCWRTRDAGCGRCMFLVSALVYFSYGLCRSSRRSGTGVFDPGV